MTPILPLGTFLITSSILLCLIPMAGKLGLIDQPGGHKTHHTVTPVIGGFGIYIGLIITYILSPVMMAHFQNLLVLSGVILLTGLIDDVRGLTASTRLVAHGCIAFAMIQLSGVKLESFGDILFLGPVELGIFSTPLTIFATVGVINAVNMSDGLDGLSSGLVIIALSFLSITALSAGAGSLLDFTSALFMTVLAFLMLNFRLLWNKTALIFLGDSGSYLLGFILAWILIESTNGPIHVMDPVYALWFFALPLMDTVSLLIKRPLSGKSPFKPGHDHLHHRLLNQGFSTKQVVLIMYTTAILLATIGLVGYFARVQEGVMFLTFILLFACFLLISKKIPLDQECNQFELP